MHIDTLWKFQAMYDFRDFITKTDVNLLIYTNHQGVKKLIHLIMALLFNEYYENRKPKACPQKYNFDVAIVEQDAMKRNPAQKNAFFHSAD